MSVSRLRAITLLLALATGPLSAAAQTKENASPVLRGQTEGNFIIKDFHFVSGEVLSELRLHHATLGTLHRNSSGEIDNAILLLHSTGGDTSEFLQSGPSRIAWITMRRHMRLRPPVSSMSSRSCQQPASPTRDSYL